MLSRTSRILASSFCSGQSGSPSRSRYRSSWRSSSVSCRRRVALICRGFSGVCAGVGGEGFKRGAVLVGNGHTRVVVGDSFFDLGDWQGRQITVMFLDASADEVKVEITGLAGAEDEPALAASAPEGAFEVVVVHAFASSRAVFDVEDLLNALEELGCDESFVAPGVFHTVIGDDAEVVEVTQQVADGVDGDGPRAGIVRLFGGRGVAGRAGSGGVIQCPRSGDGRQPDNLVPGGEADAYLVSVLGCGESVAAGSEVR